MFRKTQSSPLSSKNVYSLARHHPNVKLPPRLEDKSKREQIERCCDRFKSYPAAVDTMLKTLATILSNPLEKKYRIIDKANRGYRRSLANVPGTEQLLRAINFIPRGNSANSNQLVLHSLDHRLLQTAVHCLEYIKCTQEYKQTKTELEFGKEMSKILSTVPSETELHEREKLLSKCPKEADEGRGALIDVVVPTSDNYSADRRATFRRRFDGDDTLQDVLNWLGGEAGTIFVHNLRNRRWSIVDMNRYPRDIPIDCDGDTSTNRTLQCLGFWPSGRLILRPSSQEWMGRSLRAELMMGESRGLASIHCN